MSFPAKCGGTFHASHQALKQEIKSSEETLRDVIAQKRLGRCRITRSSCESVNQQSPQSKQVMIFVSKRGCFDV